MNEQNGNVVLPKKWNNRVYKLLRMSLPGSLLLFLLLTAPQWAAAGTLAEMLREVRSAEVNVSGENAEKAQLSGATELALAEKLFRRLFAGENSLELRQQWSDLGFELTEKRSETGPLLVLREHGKGTKKYDGKGFFVFAIDRESATVLQAPHSFRDAETEIIALELMVKNNFRAAAWNTAPVRPPVHSPLSPDSHAPPAKGYILAFTRALMAIEADSYVVQLHSFEKKKTYTSNASHADIILSGYGKQSSQAIGWLGRCLKKELDYKVRIFPFEVQEMGAGKKIPGANYSAVGELMQAEDNQGFVHLAMSSMFREELRSYPQVQQELFTCLSRE
ncbi:MAG: hypothetical protein GXP18_01595 [Gammaproteobacteria bacterium]|nr:hypothetical protein [Gammaproteobacteria bacterium]